MKERRRYAGRRRSLGPVNGLMAGFLEENPDCANELARYGVERMREDGLTDDEIRDHFDHLHEHGFGTGIDVDDLLDS